MNYLKMLKQKYILEIFMEGTKYKMLNIYIISQVQKRNSQSSKRKKIFRDMQRSYMLKERTKIIEKPWRKRAFGFVIEKLF